MGFFDSVNCANCNEQTNFLFKTKLTDGKCICKKCKKLIPSIAQKTLKKEYTFDDYKDFLSYIEYSNNYLAPVFNETHYFHQIHIDARNLIFYIGYESDKNKTYYNFSNLAEFDLLFKPETYKEGIIGCKVKGNVDMWLCMKEPAFYYTGTVAYGVKAKARTGLFSSRIRYENPKGMDFFIDAFATAWQTALEQENEEYYSYDEMYDSNSQNTTPSELQQAMALFMIDNLDEVTTSSLKLHRNRLMKTFHPDHGDSGDTKYAQKINSAYEVLNQALSNAE